eukprot:5421664-Amphidinium_carterae.1
MERLKCRYAVESTSVEALPPCLVRALQHTECSVIDPIVEYSNTTKDCGCCTVPDPHVPEVGAADPMYNLYRVRKYWNRTDEDALNITTLTIASIVTVL